MTTQIQRPKTVDVDHGVEFGEITVNKYGGKSCKIKCNGQDLYVQFPRMRLPYGLGIYQEDGSDKKKYSLDFSLSGYELDDDGVPRDPRVRDTFDFLVKMEKKLHQEASKNSDTWLDMDSATPEVAKALCRDIVKYARDKITKKITDKYAPTFKSKLGFWDDRFLCNSFNDNKQPVNDSELESMLIPGAEVIPIVKFQSVTFAGGKCGYSLLLHQQQIYTPVRMPSYAFLEDEADKKPAVKASAEEEEVEEGEEEEDGPKMVKDSDDEDDEDKDELDEDEEEEEPPPQPKKKVVKKKVVKK